MEPLDIFSRNVKATRSAAGLTQEQVADLATMDIGQYRKIENGATNASILTVSRIAGALGLPDCAPLFDGVPADASVRSRRG